MENILEIRNVVKQYESHRALDGVNFSIPKGAIYGLLGPNGAGKTSLIRIITQITRADEGQITLNGEPIHPDLIAKVGYLPEERGLYKKMKVGEQLKYFAQLKGLSKKEAMDKINHWLVKFEIAEWYDKNVEDLSKGMQQKVQFIATVMTEPELLILDEPFSGFDPVNANRIKDEILELNKKGVTIIFSTHRMESVEELCNYIGLINHSKVVLEGKLDEIKEKFRSGKYEVVGHGTLESNGTFKISEHEVLNDHGKMRYIVEPGKNMDGSVILEELIKQNFKTEVFREIYPSINEIFLEVVSQ